MGVDKKWNAEEDQGTDNVQLPPPKFSDLKTPKKIPDDSGGPDWRFSVGQLPGWAKKKVKYEKKVIPFFIFRNLKRLINLILTYNLQM